MPEAGRNRGDAPSAGRAFALLYVLPTLVLLLLAVWPLVFGLETLFFRDVLNTHLEMKWWQSEAMKEGFVPLIDPFRSGGQPHLGNPNTVALYPSNLLFLVTPLFWAFNAHFWLHLLLAPVGCFWLGRRLGMSRAAAWAAGVFYGASGYLLSNLNLYNLIAGAALIPAFAASVSSLSADPRRPWRLAAAAGLWALLILAGDPMTAVIGLGIAGSTLWIAPPRRRALGALALALGAGTLLAAPLWAEFLRIVTLSFRGHWGFSSVGATEASWHPAAILEWFVPFAFGRPDLTFWGHRFYSGSQPLFYSFYPGLFAIACLAVGVSVRRRVGRWAVAVMALGVFLALGRHNPAVVWLLDQPGLNVLRLPIKFWPLVAVPAAIVAGLGFERCLEEGGGRRLRLAAAGLATLYLVLWLATALAGASVENAIASWMPSAFASSGMAAAERIRWGGSSFQSFLLAGAVALATLTRPRFFRRLVPGLLIAHLALQLALLRPLFPSEPVEIYRSPSSASLAIPEGARAVHGAAGGLFGTADVPISEYPSPDPRWLQRQVFNEGYPFAGMMARRNFDFALSPEGLDSFLTRATAQALPLLSDTQRVRLLEASGVEWLYMKRELSSGEGAELVERFPSLGSDVLLYRLSGSARPAQFVSEFLRSDNLNQALEALVSSEFRPRSQLVLAGSGPAGSGLPGTVDVLEPSAAEAPGTSIWRVNAQGSGALLVQKTFQPIYRVEVDGEKVAPWVANMHRIAVPVGAGEHVVRLWPDRTPFRVATAVSLLTALGVLLYLAGARRRPDAGADPG